MYGNEKELKKKDKANEAGPTEQLEDMDYKHTRTDPHKKQLKFSLKQI